MSVNKNKEDFYPLASLPAVFEAVPATVRGHHILYPGYQFSSPLSVITDVGRIDFDKITHPQALWLIENEPNFARTNLIRAYYFRTSPYWEGVDPEVGSLVKSETK
jgi:hypothetical protein